MGDVHGDAIVSAMYRATEAASVPPSQFRSAGRVRTREEVYVFEVSDRHGSG